MFNKSLLSCACIASIVLMAQVDAMGQNYYARQILNKSAAPSVPPPDNSGGQWITGEWGPWDSNCSNKAFRTRPVQCYVDEIIQDDSACRSHKPIAIEIESRSSACVDILQEGSFFPHANNWETSANVTFSRAADSARWATVAPNEWVRQTTVLALEAGKLYTFNCRCEPQGGTANRALTYVLIEANGEVLAHIAGSSAYGTNVKFIGNGHPVTITLTAANQRGMQFTAMSIR